MNGVCVVTGRGRGGSTSACEPARPGRRAILLEAEGAVGGLRWTCAHKGDVFDVRDRRFPAEAEVAEPREQVHVDELPTPRRLSPVLDRGTLFDHAHLASCGRG